MKEPRPPARSPAADAPGLAARRAAADAVQSVMETGHPLEETLERLTRELDERDRALARMIAATTLRKQGSLRALLRTLMERGIPEKARRVEMLMLVGAAQILFMDVPDHAAVGTTVTLVGEQASTAGFKGLANAVLRRITREGRAILPDVADQPEWMVEGWTAAYGPAAGEAISRALAHEAPLDLTARENPDILAEKLGGRLLPTGSIRLVEAGNVTALAGFEAGEWWVQDAAAALPARLLHPAAGMSIADLCAAPGGKTAQLAAAGARVVAVDRSAPRLRRLKANMARLNLAVDILEADATRLKAGPFDAVLLDAPCSATGTIRRHPEVAWTKAPADIVSLAALQTRLLANAAELVKQGGVLVYSTCSLEPEEGERQIAAFLAQRPDFSREPVTPGECGIPAEWINDAGEVRTLPTHLPDEDPRYAGLDGFFAARLRKG